MSKFSVIIRQQEQGREAENRLGEGVDYIMKAEMLFIQLFLVHFTFQHILATRNISQPT